VIKFKDLYVSLTSPSNETMAEGCLGSQVNKNELYMFVSTTCCQGASKAGVAFKFPSYPGSDPFERALVSLKEVLKNALESVGALETPERQ
jgi:hypothetical protein